MGRHKVVREEGRELHVGQKQKRLKRDPWVDLVMVEGGDGLCRDAGGAPPEILQKGGGRWF